MGRMNDVEKKKTLFQVLSRLRDVYTKLQLILEWTKVANEHLSLKAIKTCAIGSKDNLNRLINGFYYNSNSLLSRKHVEANFDAYKDLFTQYKTSVAVRISKYSLPQIAIAEQQKKLDVQYKSYLNQADYKSWSSLKSRYNATVDFLNFNSLDNNSNGYSFVFWFGDHMQEGLGGDKSGIDNAQAALDKAYAIDQANHYYSAIESGSITPDDAIKAINADPRLALGYPSVHFTSGTNLNWKSQVGYADIVNTISNQKTNGLSKILDGYTNTAFAKSSSSTKNTYTYFIDLTSVNSYNSKYYSALNNLNISYVGVK